MVAPPGRVVNTTGCAACHNKTAPAMQLYPSVVNSTSVSYCDITHSDRCFPLGVPGSQDVWPLNTSNPAQGVIVQSDGGYAAVQLNLSCCPSCGMHAGPTAVKQLSSNDGSYVYSFSWPTAAACPTFVNDKDCGFDPLPKPTRAQLQWIENEIAALIHFNYQTSLGGDQGCGNYTPASFNPTAPNFTDQWARSIRDLGAKHAVLVAKHDCGFTLWPTAAVEPGGDTYGFSIAHSPYKKGAGDVVGEFVSSMQVREGGRDGSFVDVSDCEQTSSPQNAATSTTTSTTTTATTTNRRRPG